MRGVATRSWRAGFGALVLFALGGCGGSGDLPAAPAAEAVALEGGIARLDLRFPCGDSICAGWLFLPPGGARAPVVVMGHGLAGTRDLALPAVALRCAREGVAAFAFDYRHFGASGGAPRQLVDVRRQLEDWAAALHFVRTRAEIDPQRVAVWGTSQGAGQALVAADTDGGVRAAVGLVPLVDSDAEGEVGFFGVRWLARLLFTAWGDLLAAAFGRGPLTLPALAPQGSFGLIVDDAAFAAARSLPGLGSTWRNEVAARSILLYDTWNPAPHARRLGIPILLIASRQDRFVPFAAVEALAREGRSVRIEEIDGDHFDVYAPPRLERAAALSAEFLARALRGEGSPPD
jgi:pimeloyl-ACP methyl ester carboxylesterase